MQTTKPKLRPCSVLFVSWRGKYVHEGNARADNPLSNDIRYVDSTMPVCAAERNEGRIHIKPGSGLCRRYRAGHRLIRVNLKEIFTGGYLRLSTPFLGHDVDQLHAVKSIARKAARPVCCVCWCLCTIISDDEEDCLLPARRHQHNDCLFVSSLSSASALIFLFVVHQHRTAVPASVRQGAAGLHDA